MVVVVMVLVEVVGLEIVMVVAVVEVAMAVVVETPTMTIRSGRRKVHMIWSPSSACLGGSPPFPALSSLAHHALSS